MAKIPPERVFTIKYENFTRNITSEWSALQDFIGVSRYPELSPDIKPSIAEKEEKKLDPCLFDKVNKITSSTLERLGY